MKKSFLGVGWQLFWGAWFYPYKLYGLGIIQGLEMQRGSCRLNALDYATEPLISFAMLITVAVIIYGIVMVVGTENLTLFSPPP
ncbi:MAG TPA: hypothetical protein GX735_04890 [Firmicutes bacterium]|nr:hypothetical protein [Bacillota bacterium]